MIEKLRMFCMRKHGGSGRRPEARAGERMRRETRRPRAAKH